MISVKSTRNVIATLNNITKIFPYAKQFSSEATLTKDSQSFQAPPTQPENRTKHKIPQKRASALLGKLRMEEFEKVKKNREWPKFYAGDSIKIEQLPFLSAKQPHVIKGLVIAKTNRQSDSCVTIINVESGTPVVRCIMMYSPMIKNIEVLQRAFIHGGKKRVRRSKLYYMLKRDPSEYTVT